jgi:hypothetical protein
MRHACHDCKKKFRTEGALGMHERAKHPARLLQAQRQVRKVRSYSFLAGMLGGFLALVLLGGGAIALAVQSRALEVTPEGVMLKPWTVTVTKAASARR